MGELIVRSSVEEILRNVSLDDSESDEPSRAEALEALGNHFSWNEVVDCLLATLQDDNRQHEWKTIALAFYEAVSNGRELPADRTIALLYHRFDPDGSSENNLVWSIVSKLKNVDYLSEYNPLADPAIIAELNQLNR